MSSTMEAQESGQFEQMSERDREIQASIWALIFLVSEMALGFRILRDRLQERGALLPEDEAAINELASNEDHMRVAYAHIENAFREKYGRVMTAMENPAAVTNEVARRVQEQYTTTTVDLNDPGLPTVS